MASITVVLVEPKTPGNIGSVARVMKNFGVTKLFLVNPACNHLSTQATDLASHAGDVLRKARVGTWKDLEGFDYLIGTSAKLGSDYNIPRSPLSPREAAKKISPAKSSIALVFGREDSGLGNAEVRACDMLVSIPSSSRYRSMNLSHAVAIMLYEVFQQSHSFHTTFTPISSREKKELAKVINARIAVMPFATKEKKETQRRVWHRVLGKAMLTKREAFALLGFFRKLL